MKFRLTLLYFFVFYSLYGQWQGDVDRYKLLTDSIQLNDTIAGSAYLSIPSDIVDSAQWEFTVNMGFNPSISNYACVYIKSENANLQGNGYFVKIGGTDDEISLFRQDGDISINKKIIDGLDDRVDLSKVSVRIKVEYNDGLWQLFSKIDDETYIKEGEIIDSTYNLSSYFGIYSIYSKTRADLFSYTHFLRSGKPYVDMDAPRLDSVLVLTHNTVKFCFNEPLKSASFLYQSKSPVEQLDSICSMVRFADDFPSRDSFILELEVEDSANNTLKTTVKLSYTPFEVLFASMQSADSLYFTLNKIPSSISTQNITLNGLHPDKVIFDANGYLALFASPLEERQSRLLTIENIEDINGDALTSFSQEITWVHPRFQDLVFSEIMADPSPVVNGLPEQEYLELFNNTSYTISMEDWYLQRDEKKYYFPVTEIAPFGFVIIGSEKALAEFSSTLNKIPLTSFPSLLNEAMSLQLRSKDNTLIDYISYTKDWHNDAFHADGGFSLERIDLQNPTQQGNWMSSCSTNGGTPSTNNCVEAYQPDTIIPTVLSAYAMDEQWIYLKFSELLFTDSLLDARFFAISDGYIIDSVLSLNDIPVVDEVKLHLKTPLEINQLYELTVSDVQDMSANTMESTTFNIASCSDANSGDVVFNEIMFNPITDGAEYIELYNTKPYPLDLSRLTLSKFDSSSDWDAGSKLSDEPLLFMPETYLVLIADKTQWLEQYGNTENVLSISSFPSLNNTSGHWGLLNPAATVIDEMIYDESWHSSLLNNTKGVALERLNKNVSAMLSDNWRSASSLYNYGTPGMENSQQEDVLELTSNVQIDPEVITPDGDGIDDVASISIAGKYEGSSVKVSIFNQRAIHICDLLENDLIGSFPVIHWDGTDADGSRCPIGPYIIYVEIMTPDNKVITERKELVLSAKVK